jgi:small-conductance mechanosensitive channel
MAIDRVFREEGIEIAFPQRDIHIRSIQGPVGEATIGEPLLDAAGKARDNRRSAA